MASGKLSAIIILFSLLFCLAFATGVPCEQPKTKPTIPKTRPAIPKIIKPPSVSSPAVTSPHCPKDTLKLGICSDILGVGSVLGTPVSSKCCALLTGFTDDEAAACVCTAIKAKVLGMNLNIPISFSLLISTCKKSIPPGYQCK